MITKDQALTETVFHFERPGNRNGCERWSRNGAPKVWKTRPDEFRVPIKHGLYAYSYFTHHDTQTPAWHTEGECPLMIKKAMRDMERTT